VARLQPPPALLAPATADSAALIAGQQLRFSDSTASNCTLHASANPG
jgi:hypothetical protein